MTRQGRQPQAAQHITYPDRMSALAARATVSPRARLGLAVGICQCCGRWAVLRASEGRPRGVPGTLHHGL